MSIQTRSESNGLRDFDTIKEAIAHAQKDKTVWKISFAVASGERVRLVRYFDVDTKETDWTYEPII